MLNKLLIKQLKEKLLEEGYKDGNELESTMAQLQTLCAEYKEALEKWLIEGSETYFSNSKFDSDLLKNSGFAYPNILITFEFFDKEPDIAIEALIEQGVI